MFMAMPRITEEHHNHLVASVSAIQRRLREDLGGPPASLDEWKELCAQYDHRCLCCLCQFDLEQLTRDHIIPVGMYGSRNAVTHLQPLCRECNQRKGRNVIDFRPNLSSFVPWHPTVRALLMASGPRALRPFPQVVPVVKEKELAHLRKLVEQLSAKNRELGQALHNRGVEIQQWKRFTRGAWCD